MLLKELQIVGLLCSPDITLALRYYEPIRHPLAFAPLPGHTGYKSYLLLAISDEGEEGLLQLLGLSLSPCYRYHPAEATGRPSARLHPAMLPSLTSQEFGLRDR